MNFIELSDFILNRMRMSHIYQPVMLVTLLERGGKATVRDIATRILNGQSFIRVKADWL